MGEIADDLIDAGMMEEHSWGYSYRPRQSRYARKAPQKAVERPKVSNEDFDAWYDSINWKGCSRYEIAGMAWHEAAKRCNKEANDDHFTWWFDELPDIYCIFKTKPIVKMAWIESLKRLDIQ